MFVWLAGMVCDTRRSVLCLVATPILMKSVNHTVNHQLKRYSLYDKKGVFSVQNILNCLFIVGILSFLLNLQVLVLQCIVIDHFLMNEQLSSLNMWCSLENMTHQISPNFTK